MAVLVETPLHRGAESSHSVREKPLVFLKGSKKANEALILNSPDLFQYLQAV